MAALCALIMPAAVSVAEAEGGHGACTKGTVQTLDKQCGAWPSHPPQEGFC